MQMTGRLSCRDAEIRIVVPDSAVGLDVLTSKPDFCEEAMSNTSLEDSVYLHRRKNEIHTHLEQVLDSSTLQV